MRIGVYIDGFNLYYGLYQHGPPDCRPYKWLNLVQVGEEMSRRLNLSGSVSRARYFTAKARPRKSDPSQSTRQQMFIRALETLEQMSVHWGLHIETEKWGIEVGDTKHKLRRFTTREEKGSDVSLGVFLIRDAALKDIDAALVISNDSDLADAIHVARQDFNIPVYVVSPQPNRYVSGKLQRAASGSIVLDKSCLVKCQFPNPVIDKQGRAIRKPAIC